MTFEVAKLTYASQYKGYIHPYVLEIPAGIDGVKAFQHDGQNYLFFPHTIKNAVAMGVPPVRPDYEWWGSSHGRNPYTHQIATTNFILANKETFILSSQGTGKTLASSWAMDIMIAETKLPV